MATASIERKLTAILSADVKGYSRLMGADEVGTLRTLTAHREVTDSLIQQHFVFAHLVLASCYAELGREEEARAEAAEVLRSCLCTHYDQRGISQWTPLISFASLLQLSS